MTNPKILVTGATGRTGGAVVTQLLAKGWPVRAVVRVRDSRSDLLQCRGAEVVIADVFDPGQLMDAMRGVQRAYYCPPYHPFVIQSASAFAAAARETGLEQIVGLSQWLAGPNHPALVTRQSWLIDRMFAAQGQEPVLLSGLRHYFQDHDRGAFAIGAPNDTVRELTGKEAENFETIARRHAALPECHQSFSARLAAFARFMAVPILPGFDPVAYDRAQEQPVPPAPRLALDDTDWTASHGAEGAVIVRGMLKEALV